MTPHSSSHPFNIWFLYKPPSPCLQYLSRCLHFLACFVPRKTKYVLHIGSSGVFRSDRISLSLFLLSHRVNRFVIFYMSHDLFLLPHLSVFTVSRCLSLSFMFSFWFFGLDRIGSDRPLLTCSIVFQCISQRLGWCLEGTLENEKV
jgi:hypothetical protein